MGRPGRRHNPPDTETFVKMIVESPPPMPVLQSEHEKEYRSDNTGYSKFSFNPKVWRCINQYAN